MSPKMEICLAFVVIMIIAVFIIGIIDFTVWKVKREIKRKKRNKTRLGEYK